MVAIDTSERAHVIDVRSEEELEVIDLVDVQLAYSTSFYKSLATGGNVSQALVSNSVCACLYACLVVHVQLKYSTSFYKSLLTYLSVKYWKMCHV